MGDSDATTSAGGNAAPRFRDAYQRLLEEFRSVPEDDLLTINIDTTSAITTALGILSALRTLRPRIATELPAFDVVRFDKIEAYTLALAHAQALHSSASAPPEAIQALVDSGTRLREILLSDATALANRQYIDGQQLKGLRGTTGHKNLGFDLLTLSALLREHWNKIADRTALSTGELDEAETLADRLLTAVGHREHLPQVTAETAAIRQRAFTLFAEAYEDARRAVSFLRWHQGDADEIIPSLYAGRNTGKRKPAPASDASSPGTPVGSGPASTTAFSTTPSGPSETGAVGLPGSTPFRTI